MILQYLIEYLDSERNVIKFDYYGAMTRREAHARAQARILFLVKWHPAITGYRVKQMVGQSEREGL
ncbi:MAG TPA: hypothetical protein VHY59_00490 [Chthoniobacterales bacterium]|jgi:hypothetical protein|nr:hypothetical protein [Chthoniobacterales bacterium]